MKIASVLLALASVVCATSSAVAQPPPKVCSAPHARVEVDTHRWVATYSRDGKVVGSSTCGGTRMAVYSMACRDDPAFDFYFAAGGKQARLDAGGSSVLLACR